MELRGSALDDVTVPTCTGCLLYTKLKFTWESQPAPRDGPTQLRQPGLQPAHITLTSDNLGFLELGRGAAFDKLDADAVDAVSLVGGRVSLPFKHLPTWLVSECSCMLGSRLRRPNRSANDANRVTEGLRVQGARRMLRTQFQRGACLHAGAGQVSWNMHVLCKLLSGKGVKEF